MTTIGFMESNLMFVPKETQTSTTSGQRIGISGEPGSGKTKFACEFPNIFAVDFDHKLPPGIPCIEFWKPEVVNAIKPSPPGRPPNRRDALVKWLTDNIHKFTAEQTLLLDSWTHVQAAFDEQEIVELKDANLYEQKDGSFKFYRHKFEFSNTVLTLLKSAKCTVIVTFHERPERDKDGAETGKLRAVQDGSFADVLPGYFTNFYRAVIEPVELNPEGRPVMENGKARRLRGHHIQLLPTAVFATINPPGMGEYIYNNNVRYIPNNYAAFKELYEKAYAKS